MSSKYCQVQYFFLQTTYNSLVRNTKITKKHLIVGEASSFVSGEDLCDRVNVGCCSQINAKIVLLSCLHDCLGCSLHGVVKTRVDNVLLRCSSHLGQEFITWSYG